MSELIRINKYLANKGLCSRREADEWLMKGFIFVNGDVITELGAKVNPKVDVVEVKKDLQETKRYFLLNKPTGYLSTVSENEGKSLLRLLPKIKGLFPIGRLDKDSSGLIIVTNDRTLTKYIIGEATQVEKEYEVLLSKRLSKSAQIRIEKGVNILGSKTLPCKIVPLDRDRYSVVLTEGKNRQVRRIFKKVDNSVLELVRVRIGGLHLDFLQTEQYIELNRDEIVRNL